MTITPWQMYWLVILDGVKIIGDALSFFGVLFIVVGLFTYAFTVGETPLKGITETAKKATYVGIVCVVIAIGCVFIPTTKQMAAIMVVPKIVNNQKVQEIPNKVLDLANLWLEELKPNKD